ncbi:unnamed protein product [Adineta steineri]|uniref:Uncharacterized protein n=1 Tax=Adineta steineri TaxID=433720 RepID=A0A814PBU6_9BILA|nr:unnamed protein product [Adineta steineri]CAF1102534.1 unnamed protein product [Adineta steineri]
MFESQLERTTATEYNVDLRRAHICNRGILIYEHTEERCLCPPAYYGLRCEFQNQRVSITFQIRTALWHTHFQFVIMLIDNDEHEIESYEQISYLGIRDCNFKYNLNLLYTSRPKHINKSYSVRIDAFDALSTSVIYHGSWLFPITHFFLPVYRLAFQLSVRVVYANPLKTDHTNCSCGSHGQCFAYMNTGEYFCRCIHHGWRGKTCQIPTEITPNYCLPDSVSIGSSICVCPLGKFGSRCLISFASICSSSNPCAHGGTCIPVNPRMTLAYSSLFTCACNEGFSGKTCEQIDAQLDIHFPHGMSDIPSSVLIHFITVIDNNDPERTTTVKRIPFGQNSIRVYRSFPFHLVFVEIMKTNHQQKSFYLVLTQQIYIPAANISTSEFHRCLPINELFNSTILSYSLLRRVKYYHKACQKHLDLTCFYDDEQFMCLCTEDHNANCFPFDFNMSYTCQGYDYCENNGECFQNHPTCPTSAVCSCPECYYGSRCQFYTYGFGISLDTILGYHIWPRVTLSEQPAAFKLSIIISVFICVLGLINGALTAATFYSETSDDTGCRVYLYTGAINSLFITFLFALKFIFLVITQLNILTSYIVLTIQCLSIDFVIKILLAANDWFASCVAIERVFTIIHGIQFNNIKSKRIAKYMTFSVYLFTCTSYLHESIYRSLVDDVGDQRTWCIVRYPRPAIQDFASSVNIFHLIVPFSINILSAILIILCMTRIRFHVKKQQIVRRQVLYQQFIKYKHLFISSILLVILKLPGLLISVLSGCMKSQSRDIPWLFLSGYFMSFVPSLLTFITFVIPSVTYMSSFQKVLQKVRRTTLYKKWHCM